MRQKEDPKINPKLIKGAISTLEDILEGSYENGNLSVNEYEDCLQLLEYVHKITKNHD